MTNGIPISHEEIEAIKEFKARGLGPTDVHYRGLMPGRTYGSIKNMFCMKGVSGAGGTTSIAKAMERARQLSETTEPPPWDWMNEYGCLLRQDVPMEDRHRMFKDMHGDWQHIGDVVDRVLDGVGVK